MKNIDNASFACTFSENVTFKPIIYVKTSGNKNNRFHLDIIIMPRISKIRLNINMGHTMQNSAFHVLWNVSTVLCRQSS